MRSKHQICWTSVIMLWHIVLDKSKDWEKATYSPLRLVSPWLAQILLILGLPAILSSSMWYAYSNTKIRDDSCLKLRLKLTLSKLRPLSRILRLNWFNQNHSVINYIDNPDRSTTRNFPTGSDRIYCIVRLSIANLHFSKAISMRWNRL